MYSTTRTPYGKTPGTAKKAAPKRPAPKPPATSTDPVEVYCRIRPLDSPSDGPKCIKIAGPDTVILTVAENSHAARNGGVLKETKYTFKQVFDELCPQKAVFEQVALPLVEDVLHGKNALLFAYGITSSGKTYTMMGEPHDPGILPRCLDVIFNSIGDLQAKKYVFKPDKMNGFEVQSEAEAMLERQQKDILSRLNNPNNPKTPSSRYAAGFINRARDDDHNNSNNRHKDRSRVANLEEDNSYAVFMSYVEIYNKYIYDLLEETEYDPITVYKPPTSKCLREDNNHNMYVSGAVEVEVKSTEEAYEVMEKGQRKRRVAATSLNAESSRSHSVLNIRIVQAPLDNMGQEVLRDKIIVGQLSLVDLAGSERAARTGSKGDRIREAGNINNALMHLRTCMEVLRENQRTGDNKYVPYRYDRMTHLFKNYFDGEGKVRMIVCVNPSAREYDETVNVLKFAMMTQEVQVARSEKKEFDLGLMQGRRQLKDKLREEAEKSKAMKVSPPTPAIFSFAPFPPIEVLQFDDANMLPDLARYLQDRINQRKRLVEEYSQEEAAFRAHLVDIEREHSIFKLRIQEQEEIIKSKDCDIARLEKKIRNLEKAHESLSKKNSSLERAKNSLEREVGEREWQLQMAVNEKNRLEQDNRHRLTRMERNCNKRIEESKMKVNEDAMARLKSHESKLAKVRNLLESEGEDVYMTPLTTRSGARYMAKSETDLTSTGKTPASSQRTTYRPVTRQAATRTPRSGVPPPTKPKPNVKMHRRSKSSHEVYLDHKPRECSDPKSILTTGVKKTRSVTRLESRDMKGADKYLLTCMDVDSDGDLATKFYKGDILRTSTGGKSVILNDVEVIKHKSPGDKKRKSDEYFPYEVEDSEEIQDRCRIAVEGHGQLKRIKHSQV